MKTRYTVMLAIVAGFGLGALAIEGLHAQAKPPVYYIAEIDVHDLPAYLKEFARPAQRSVVQYGGRFLAGGMHAVSIEGAPPKRIAVQVWDSMEKLQAWRHSPEYVEARKVGDKYATFRGFAIEALPTR